MVYSKPAITVNAQLHQLKSRGMGITNHSEAKHYLRAVGYYRLEGYWWTMQSDPVNHQFRRGSQFEKVLERYNFDRELRLIAMNMIERVEVGVRTQLIYHLSLAHGSHWFEDKQLAKHNGHWKKNLEKIRNEVTRSKEKFITEHFKIYHSDPRNPPAWKSLEVTSLGLLSKVYRNLNDRLAEKNEIAHNLGLPSHVSLVNWLHAISLLRNIIAHHCRLFERSLDVWPSLPKELSGPWMTTRNISTKSVYANLCCMKYLLHKISPDSSFSERLYSLFERYPLVKHQEVGFPANWKTQPLWK